MPRNVQALLDELEAEVRELKRTHGGSRFVGPGADPAVAQHVADGGTVDYRSGFGRPAPPRADGRGHGLGAGMTKALAEATGSAGGYLVPVELSDQIADLIRARAVVRQFNPTVIPNVRKETDIPGLTGAATASWVAENAAIPVSQETFAIAARLVPKPIAAMVPVSRKLLLPGEESNALRLDQIISADLSKVLALGEDLAFLNGSGSGQPLGILQTPGVTAGPSLGTNGASLTYDHCKAIVNGLRAINAPFQNPGWVFHPRTLQTLDNIKDSLGRYLMDTGLLTYNATGGGGTLLGFKFATTTQIPVTQTQGSSTTASSVIFASDWGEMFIGEGLRLTLDTSSDASYTPDGGTTWINAFQNQQVLFRACIWEDAVIRRPQLFSVTTGVLP